MVSYDDKAPSLTLATGEVHKADVIVAVDGEHITNQAPSPCPSIMIQADPIRQELSRLPASLFSATKTNPSHPGMLALEHSSKAPPLTKTRVTKNFSKKNV